MKQFFFKNIFFILIFLTIMVYSYNYDSQDKRNLASEATFVQDDFSVQKNDNSCFNELEERALTLTQLWQSDVTFNNWMDAVQRAFRNPYSFDMNEFLNDNEGNLTSRFTAGRNLNRCEKYQVMKEKLREIDEAKDSYEEQKKDIIETRESLLIFLKIVNMPEKIACHKNCEINLRKELREKDCLRYCGFPEDQYIKKTFENIPGKSSYIDYKSCKKLSEDELNKLKQYYTQALRHLRRRKPQIVQILNDLLSKYKTDSISLPAEMSKFRDSLAQLGTTECKNQLDYNENIAKNASRSITSSGGQGTGFFAYAGGEQYFLSAQHVAVANSDDLAFLKFPSLHYLENGKKHYTQFSMKPGLYDRGRDVVAYKTDSSATGLKIIEADKLPSLGQKFTSFGYPRSRQSEWSSYSCFFVGYYTPSEYTESNYLLRCPSMTKTLMGVSGGPLVDDHGQVWGVNRAEIVGGNLIVVSPIYQKEQRLTIGIQQRKTVDHCFKDTGNSLTQYSCSIFSNNNIDTF